eukprot:gene16223-18364_t
MLPLYGWNWTDLLQCNFSNEYLSFLNRVKHLYLKGDLDYHHLHQCPAFSALETLSLEGCRFDNSVMQYFLRSTKLQCLHLTSPIKFRIEGSSTATLFSEFFGRIKMVKVERAIGFLHWVSLISQTTALVDIVLSAIYPNKSIIEDNRTFFQQCPDIQYLTLQGVRIDYSFFHAIQDLQRLYTLRFYFCEFFLSNRPTVPAIQVKCKRLEILYPYCAMERSRVSVLDFFNKELQHLSFTACNDICFTLEAFESIPAILPNLLSFEINDRESQEWPEE